MAEITIKDIAKQCGVGISTVSRALNNHPDINPETKKMIMEVIEKNGFVPNNSARNLKRTDAKCIAVLIKGITNPFFNDMVGVIEDIAARSRYALVMRHVEPHEDEMEVALELEKEKRLRGILFLGGRIRSEDAENKLKVPFVITAIGSEAQEKEEYSFSNISVDDRLESKKMTEYLLSQGHRRIAIVAEKPTEPIGKLRLEGYRDAFITAGLNIDENLIWYVGDNKDVYSMENGYVTVKHKLGEGIPVTAVYATADSLAIGACRAILEAGLQIPKDISVAGFDGIEMGEYYNPKITTIKQPVKEMARMSIELLLDIIAERKKHQRIILPAELVVRESTE